MLWGGKLNFGLGIKHGWKPLGKPRTVTQSLANVVLTIDDRPAAQLYTEYLACDMEKLNKELKYISLFYPLGLYLEGEDEYLLRNITAINSDGSLVLQGNIPEKSKIRLMIGTKESCLLATQQATDEAKAAMGHNPVDFVLVFDSVSRYMLLGRDAHKELEIIKKGFDEGVPVIGIYTYGEQAPLKSLNYYGKAYLHNQTVTILAIGGIR